MKITNVLYKDKRHNTFKIQRTLKEYSCKSLQLHSLCLNKNRMKRKIILYSTTVLLLLMAAQSAMAQTKGKKPKSFSPKMLVYENLKNNNVLRHFKQRFAQLDTLIKNPIWVKAPVIELGLNKQHHADINKTDSLFWSKTAHEHLALNRHNGLEVTGQVYARPDSYFDSDEDDAKRYQNIR